MRIGKRGAALAVLIITAGGAVLRLLPTIGGGFPLEDGGLFLAMMRQIQSSGAVLPPFVNYNGHDIPFAYPPLGLFLGAMTSTVTGADLLGVERVLPVLVSILTIPVSFLVFRQILATEFRALVATAAFAVMPRSYNWIIAGGGITRSIGLLAALLTIAAAIRVYHTGRPRWAVVAGVFLGVTGLSHPQAGVFAGLSLLVLLPFAAKDRRTAVRGLAMAIVVAFLVLSPWLLTVLIRHGPETLLGAAQAGASVQEALLMLITFRFSDGLFEVMGIIGAFGLFVCLVNRLWLLPIWVLVVFLGGSRAALSFGTVPVGAAVAYAVADGMRLLRIKEPLTAASLYRAPAAVALSALLFGAATVDSIASRFDAWSPLHPLPVEQRVAMEWIGTHTAADAQIMVVSGAPWPVDATSEWLPVISGRRSVATVQGTEWLGPGVFKKYEQRDAWLQSCAATTDLSCARLWSEQVGPVDYVLAVRSRAAATEGYDCCLPFAERLVADGGIVVYEADGVSVVRVDLAGPDG